MRKNGQTIACACCGKDFYKAKASTRTFCSQPCWYKSKPKTPLDTRLWRHIDKSGGEDACWNWTGTILKTGYGSMGLGWQLKTKRAHRLAYESVNGPIPEGAHVLHKCDNRRCCNPSHHFLGNAKINSDDKIAKGRDKNRGEASPKCKIAHTDVLAIKALRETHSGKYVANLFGLSEGHVSNIYHGKSRKYG